MPASKSSQKLKRKNEYAFQDLDLTNIKNESWTDIPGLDGYFAVSCFGRIKRMRYERQYKNGRIYIKDEKIIKPQIARVRNTFKKDVKHFLVSAVTLGGKRYRFSVGRLVYYCFVKEFDLEDVNFVIFYRDNNSFNIRPSNLQLVTLQDKQQRVVRLKRSESHFGKMQEGQKKMQRAAIAATIEKPVVQYSMKGKVIKEFKSLKHAEIKTGIHASSIGSAAAGNLLSSGGFRWSFKGAKLPDINLQKQARRENRRKNYGLRVTQYDMRGNRIKVFNSLQDAHEQTGASPSTIRKVIEGEYKSAKGFYWKDGIGKSRIDLGEHKWGRESMAVTQSRKISQYSLDGKKLETYPSIKEAAKRINRHPTSIIDACAGRSKTCSGYLWKYA